MTRLFGIYPRGLVFLSQDTHGKGGIIMKSKTKGRLKLATLVGCTLASACAFGTSIYGTCKIVDSAVDYQTTACILYRDEQYAKIDEAYAKGEFDDITYIVKFKEVASLTNKELILSGMQNGSEKVQALLKDANIGYWTIPALLAIPLTFVAAAASGIAAKTTYDCELD